MVNKRFAALRNGSSVGSKVVLIDKVTQQLPFSNRNFRLIFFHIKEQTIVSIFLCGLDFCTITFATNAKDSICYGMKRIPILTIIGALQLPTAWVAILVVASEELIAVNAHGRRALVLNPSLCSSFDCGGYSGCEVAIRHGCCVVFCEGCGEGSAAVSQVGIDGIETVELPPVQVGLSCSVRYEIDIVNACHGLVYHLCDGVPSLCGGQVASLDCAKQDALRVGLVEIDIDACCAETYLCAKFDMRGGLVAKVNPTVADVVLVLHRSDHSAFVLVFIPLVNDRSVLNEVEVLRLILGIGIMIDDGSEVTVEGGRDASHVAIVAEVLQFASFLMLEVLLGFGQPSGRGYAGRVAIVPCMISILGNPIVM